VPKKKFAKSPAPRKNIAPSPTAHERRAHAPLDRHERGDQPERQRAEAERARRAPAVALGLDDHIDQEREPAGDAERAQVISSALCDLGARAGHEAQRQRHRDHADRHVDEEDPRPRQRLREHAAEQQADRRAAGGERRPQAQRLALGIAGGEGGVDDRERRGGHEGRPDPLGRTRADQHRGGAREPIDERGGGEERDAGEEQAAAPEQVREASAQEQEAAEGQRVGVDDPLQVGRAEPQAVLDRGQRDVHDGRVEHHHQLREADDGDAEPGVVGGPGGLVHGQTDEDDPRVIFVSTLADPCACQVELTWAPLREISTFTTAPVKVWL
jgi:hypothetical protein